jgi:membrane associated rhomboid family serine protease
MIPLRDANPTRRTPLVTLAIVIACFVAFGYELGLLASGGEDSLNDLVTTWGVVPADITAAFARGDYLSSETLTLVTSQFLHGGWLHLLGNLLFLWIFGNNIEDRFGRLRFLLFYLAGGVVAGLCQVVITPTSDVPTIGASGAIAATLGAYIVLFPRARVTSLVFLGFFYQLIDVPAVIVLAFWFVLQLIDGLTSLGVTDLSGGVAFFAHIGGFAFGAALATIVAAAGRRTNRRAGRGPSAGPSATPAVG